MIVILGCEGVFRSTNAVLSGTVYHGRFGLLWGRAGLGGSWGSLRVCFGGFRWSWVLGALRCSLSPLFPLWVLALSFLPASSPSPLSLSLSPLLLFPFSSPPLPPLAPALVGSGPVSSPPSFLLSGAAASSPPAASVVVDRARFQQTTHNSSGR